MDNEKFQELVLEQLKSLTTQVTSIDNRLGNVEQGQKSLEQGQKSLEQSQKSLATRIDNLEQDQQLIIKTLQKHSVQLEDLQKAQTRLETRMENEVIEKIHGLYEDRKVQHEVNSRVLAALERIESKITTHDVQIHILDKTKANKRKAK